MIVDNVEPGSAADLRTGDIITGEPIEDSGDLLGTLRDYQPGDDVEVTLGERTV